MTTSDPLARNRGLISETEQLRLREARVLVAGVGGVGGRTAETLARMGVGTLILADPDTFSVSNLNRQAGATAATLGRNKAEVLAEHCASLGMNTSLVVVTEGVTASNVDELVGAADVVIDGTDYTLPDLGLRLARSARQQSVPVVLGVEIGFGVWHTVIPPDGPRFERLLGIHPTATLEDLSSGRLKVPLWRWVVSVPPYADVAVLAEVEKGRLEAPAIAPAVELCSAILATATLGVLAGGRPLVAAPRIHHFDSRTGRAKRLRASKARFYVSALRASMPSRPRA